MGKNSLNPGDTWMGPLDGGAGLALALPQYLHVDQEMADGEWKNSLDIGDPWIGPLDGAQGRYPCCRRICMSTRRWWMVRNQLKVEASQLK